MTFWDFIDGHMLWTTGIVVFVTIAISATVSDWRGGDDD